jgi:hypothetical protein
MAKCEEREMTINIQDIINAIPQQYQQIAMSLAPDIITLAQTNYKEAVAILQLIIQGDQLDAWRKLVDNMPNVQLLTEANKEDAQEVQDEANNTANVNKIHDFEMKALQAVASLLLTLLVAAA